MQSWKNLTTDQRIDAITAIYPDTTGTATSLSEALTKKYSGEDGEKITRNSVISYYGRYPDRLKSVPLTGRRTSEVIAAKPAPARSAPVPKKKIKRPSMLLAATGVHFSMPNKPTAVAAEAAPALPVPEPLLLRLFELERNHCKWPVAGDRENTLFCGADQIDNGPYCACHKAMSIGRGSRAERDAIPVRKAA